MACLSPAMPTGHADRTCTGSGEWTGTDFNCTLPDFCAANPCSEYSVCVSDLTNSQYFRCDCLPDATGEPGDDGSGCTVPTIIPNNGSVVISVSNANDIEFSIGGKLTTVLDYDSRLTAITVAGGAIDTSISTALVQATNDTINQINSGKASQIVTLSTLISNQMSNVIAYGAQQATNNASAAGVAAAADISNKAASTLTLASSLASTSMSAAVVQAVSQIKAYDAQVSTSAAQNTESARVLLSTQLSCKLTPMS